MPSFLIDGEQAHPGLDSFADAIAAAYAQRRRPQCLCSTARPAMCIAKLGPRYILRRMPGSGQQHDSGCRSWTGAWSVVAGRHRLHRASVRFHDTLLISPGVASASSVPPPSPVRFRPKLSAQELLVDLWIRSSLTAWLPLSDEHRSWKTVRGRLLAAAAGLHHGRQPLLERLYIPEPFDLDHVSEIYARRRARWREIRQVCSTPGDPAFVIAEVKACKTIKRGQHFLLRHIPDRSLEAETSGGQTPQVLRADRTPQHRRDAHVVVMVTVDLGSSSWHWRPGSGVLHVDSLWRPLIAPCASDSRNRGERKPQL